VGIMRNDILMECTTPQTLVLLAQGQYAPSAPLACAGTSTSPTVVNDNRHQPWALIVVAISAWGRKAIGSVNEYGTLHVARVYHRAHKAIQLPCRHGVVTVTDSAALHNATSSNLAQPPPSSANFSHLHSAKTQGSTTTTNACCCRTACRPSGSRTWPWFLWPHRAQVRRQMPQLDSFSLCSL